MFGGLFGKVKDAQARVELCAAFEGMGAAFPAIRDFAASCAALNALQTGELDAVDYDARLRAYRGFGPGWWVGQPAEVVQIFLAQCFHDMLNAGDLALRQTAGQGVMKFLQGLTDGSPATRAVLGTNLLRKFVFSKIKSALSNDSVAVRQEHVAALQTLAQRFPQFEDLRPLSHADPEQDFFHNVLHLQVHRRARAVHRLRRRVHGTRQARA